MTTLAHISDLHFGVDLPGVADSLVQDIASIRPDVLVVSGDLTQRARRGQYLRARQYLSRLPHPQIIVPGNHDVPLYAFWRRIFSPFGRFQRYACDDPWPAWHNDEVSILGMNTACRIAPRISGFWKDGKITDEQNRQIRGRFASFASGPAVRVLVAHHPFIEPPGGHAHGIVHGAAGALQALEDAKVDLILSGHLHMAYYYDLRVRHTQVNRPMINVVAGSAISRRHRDPYNSYNVIRITGTTIDIEIRDRQDGQWVVRQVVEEVRT